MPDKVTVDPSAADKLVDVRSVLVCTALAFVPFNAVVPPTVGLNISWDFAYASDVLAKPKIAALDPE